MSLRTTNSIRLESAAIMRHGDEIHQAPDLDLRTANDWSKMNELAYEFHDAIIRAIDYLAPDFVDTDGALVYGDEAVVDCLVQSQFRDVGELRLRFRGVKTFSVDVENDMWPAKAVDNTDSGCDVALLSIRIAALRCEVWLKH